MTCLNVKNHIDPYPLYSKLAPNKQYLNRQRKSTQISEHEIENMLSEYKITTTPFLQYYSFHNKFQGPK